MGAFTDAATQRKSGPECLVCAAVRDSDESDDITAALADPSMTNAAIKRGLIAIGYKVGPDAVGRHRRSECSGPKA